MSQESILNQLLLGQLFSLWVFHCTFDRFEFTHFEFIITLDFSKIKVCDYIYILSKFDNQRSSRPDLSQLDESIKKQSH